MTAEIPSFMDPEAEHLNPEILRDEIQDLNDAGMVVVGVDPDSSLSRIVAYAKDRKLTAQSYLDTFRGLSPRKTIQAAILSTTVMLGCITAACGENEAKSGEVTGTATTTEVAGFGGGDGNDTEVTTVPVIVHPTKTSTPEPTATYTPSPEPTATDTPEPTATATSTATPTEVPPTPTPELTLEQKIEAELPYELSAERLTFSKESGELKYLPNITIGVDQWLTNEDGSCQFMDPITKQCLSIGKVDINVDAFPGLSPEQARLEAAHRLEEAVLISYTYALHSQNPDQYGSLTVDELKSMIEQGTAPDLVLPKTLNKEHKDELNSQVSLVNNGLRINLTGPGNAGSLSISSGSYVGFREEYQTLILELTEVDLFTIKNQERVKSRLAGTILRGLQFLSDYEVINGNYEGTIPRERLLFEGEQMGGYQIRDLLIPITDPFNQGVLIPLSAETSPTSQ